jgi:oxalate---CoA ligase
MLEWVPRKSSDPALVAADGTVTTYTGLVDQITTLSQWLRGFVAPQQVVAVVAGNGPDAVPVILGTASACVCAPLPAGRTVQERVEELRAIGASALLVLDGEDETAAHHVGIPVLSPGQSCGPVTGPHCSVPETALLVRTSGSTGAGKLVPLTGPGLLHAASLVATTLGLSPADRGLNALPLHHTHGLVGAVMSSLTAGASVICLPKYTDDGMTDAFGLDPTWYTAVPAIHARVAASAEAGKLTGHRLRFTRSASAPLTQALRTRLAKALGVPVLQAYALTEAPGQVTAHRLADSAGSSVGRPAGGEVRILESGEIAVRGPHVSPGYLSSVDGPLTAHPDGWLHTGDLGRLTPDGLLLSGRRDDVINRAGEKVLPEEIENALAALPGVIDVVVAGAPDPVLGEAVVAFVAGDVSQEDVRRALSRVPDRIVLVPRIPRSATGKVNRGKLADAHTVTGDLVQAVARIWSEVLFLPGVDPDTSLADLGGESLHGARIEALVGRQFGVQLPVLDGTITVRTMAALVAGHG